MFTLSNEESQYVREQREVYSTTTTTKIIRHDQFQFARSRPLTKYNVPVTFVILGPLLNQH